jgi:hypothetical protein
MKTSDESLKETGRRAVASIVEMVAALECDYDRLEELREWDANIKTLPTICMPMTTEDRIEHADLEKAAGECTSREDAETRIQEDVLSVQVRSGWQPVDPDAPFHAEEFCILLSTGGPASRIRGEIDQNGEPSRAWLEVQDWGTPCTQVFDIGQDTLLSYARCFYFGEG